ncbi:MAG: xanthine dehydrogenase accessory protein XdhC [Burkholderiaceae bacterium]|jgi:xanthine dehydrogenase accessory factor|nr:xanthine dehydrogenase accessory protein XdhC [Burkholderiales bacterium]MCZ8339915.1 xanthine dehydrogenase accessory protein XdhC [Burkholderiaceae bacterium]
MSVPGARLIETARAGAPAVWVRVECTRGSAPREPGASMLVGALGEAGTIGGGHLEFEAIAQARRMLASGVRVAVRDVVLGASAGQCCGGAVVLSMRRIDARESPWLDALARLDEAGGTLWLATRAGDDDAPHTVVADAPPERPAEGTLVSRVDVAPWRVWLFGAGHVGEAVVRVLATLPLHLVWVDARADRFPAALPANVEVLESDSPAHEVRAIPSGADVLVMTHSHALDFDVCVALLAREDLGAVGVIGSATKAASFRARLARRGVAPGRIARLRCPIGEPPRGSDGPAVAVRHALDRHPGAIAISVAFELWSLRRARVPAGVPATGATR